MLAEYKNFSDFSEFSEFQISEFLNLRSFEELNL